MQQRESARDEPRPMKASEEEPERACGKERERATDAEQESEREQQRSSERRANKPGRAREYATQPEWGRARGRMSGEPQGEESASAWAREREPGERH